MEDDEFEPRSPAEVQLVDLARNSVRSGDEARALWWSQDDTINVVEMDGWGEDRVVRASILEAMLGGYYLDLPPVAEIYLKGAVIQGELSLLGSRRPPGAKIRLESCRVDGLVTAPSNSLGRVEFDGSRFTRAVDLTLTEFHQDVSFRYATFVQPCVFKGATFKGQADFRDASFHSVDFSRAVFERGFYFCRSTVIGASVFASSTFARGADFTSCSFSGPARFVDALAGTFTNVEAGVWYGFRFDDAQFYASTVGPWVAEHISLTGATFHSRCRLELAASMLVANSLQAKEGIHLVVRSDELRLADAQFLKPSIVAAGERAPGRWSEFREAGPMRDPELRHELRVELAKKFGERSSPKNQVFSLSGALVSDLVLEGIDLSNCAFFGVHGLDEIRLDSSCSFGRPPVWTIGRWSVSPYSQRRVLSEEAHWRSTHTRRWPNPKIDVPVAGAPEGYFRSLGRWPQTHRRVLQPTQVAGIYRNLRKSLEDSKDEPEAADFYYGEMEMRRLSARRPRGRHSSSRLENDGVEQVPSRSERWLLAAYWVISGYGLRASRAILAYAVLIVVCAVLFTNQAFARLAPTPDRISSVNVETGEIAYAPGVERTGERGQISFAESLEFSVRESLALLRLPGNPSIITVGTGTVLDMLLRLLGPLLLGLGALAVRGRTKR
ncbi:pentapeptide repeat-containing protein [Actinomycetospora lemnae]|uniref:Pentapeptide repeat-containing protein n=1 Tax=Actinomycetospora lemnae TaxID=3019891 RepID=A0ABT5SRN4_9PSEU|nr:pentapeptide repeat-containing protein [Actinomycetospora sp. DW7H6]MDD7965500.1 pentapeptide repeat-containing protein [Actinomycetospora sp. DW7H6]